MRDRIAGEFRDRMGRQASLLVRAPGRVNLIGDHTDYNDGFVLPAAIRQATWIAVAPRPDRIVRLHSVEEGSATIDLDALQPVHGWADYVAGTIWALEPIEYGFDAVIGTTIPVGAGLSSSAALEMGTARLVAELEGRQWDPVGAALAGRRAENDFVGMPCGIMDQLIVATAQPGAASLIDCRSLDMTPAPVPAGVIIVILDSGTRRRLVSSAYEDRRVACERVAAALGVPALRDATTAMVDAAQIDAIDRRRAIHVISENARTRAMASALHDGNAAAAGGLMNESHASLRNDYAVSSPELDVMAEIARSEPSCLGARMTGAGFAGCAVALVERDHVDDFQDAVERRHAAETGRRAALYPTEASEGVMVM